MANGFMDEDQDEITGINITPLVDVMLVLLIIFMVTANYVSSSSIGLNIPEAKTGEVSVNNKNLELIIDSKSQVYVDGNLVGFENVGLAITKSREKIGQADLAALITADVETPHGEVIKLIDIVRKNGIKRVCLKCTVT